MFRSIIIGALLVVFFSQVGFSAEVREVSQGFELTVDEQKFVLTNAVSKIEIDGKERQVAVRPLEAKTFDDRLVSFQFPSHISVVKEEEPEYTMWDFNGDDVYMALTKAPQAESRDFADNYPQTLREQYEGAKTSKTKLQLGADELTGTRFEVSLVGSTIVQDVYSFEVEGQWYVLLLQDSGGQGTSEMNRIRALLKQTFRRKAGTGTGRPSTTAEPEKKAPNP